MARIYLEVVQGHEFEDIEEAVMRFIHGKDSRHKKEFAPTPSILADMVRQCRDRRLDEINRQRKALEQISQREVEIVKSEESRKRVLEMAKQFASSQAQNGGSFWDKTTPESAQQWLDERKR